MDAHLIKLEHVANVMRYAYSKDRGIYNILSVQSVEDTNAKIRKNMLWMSKFNWVQKLKNKQEL